jgi:hypothetical protein
MNKPKGCRYRIPFGVVRSAKTLVAISVDLEQFLKMGRSIWRIKTQHVVQGGWMAIHMRLGMLPSPLEVGIWVTRIAARVSELLPKR